MGRRLQGEDRMSEPEARSKFPTLVISLSILILGGIWVWISLTPDISPLGSEDLDQDGVNDFFQDLDPIVEYRLDEDGKWHEERLGYTSSIDIPLVIFYSVFFLIVVPASVYAYVHMRPVREEQRRSSRENGVMYDAVRRMASFLEVTPSLIYSVKYSIQSMAPDDRKVLSCLIWDSRGGGKSFARSYSDFRRGWSERDPLISKALSDLEQAGSEPTHPEVKRSARRTIRELTSGARRKATEYSESLKAPSTGLFAVGVLLPVLLATMIPVAGLGEGTVWMLAILLWFILPGGIMIIGGRLVRKRPLFGVETSEPSHPTLSLWCMVLSSAGVVLLILFAYSIIFETKIIDPAIPISGKEISYLGLILSLALIIGGFSLFIDGGAGRRTNTKEDVMKEAPNLLLELGSRVQEGLSFEASMSRAVSASGENIREMRGSVAPPPGVVKVKKPPSWLSHLISASRQFSRAGSEAGGTAIKALGGHIRELNNLKDEMAVKVKSAVGQMEITASLIAPVMIGGSVAIFHLLDSTPVSDGGPLLMMGSPASETIPSTTFILLTGGYLLLLSITTTLVLYRLKNGSEKGGWHLVPTRVLAAAVSYVLGAIGGSFVIG